jgi:hypothetical protein
VEESAKADAPATAPRPLRTGVADAVNFAVDAGEGFVAGLDAWIAPELQPGNIARLVLTALRGTTVESDEPGPVNRAHDPGTDERVIAALQDPVRVASATLTAGFVWWLTRSGGLITSILMGIPAWRHVDLLPVLAARRDDEHDENEPQGEDFALDSPGEDGDNLDGEGNSVLDRMFSNTSRMFGESRFTP